MQEYIFSDKVVREDDLDIVFVKRTKSEMKQREEYNSNLWEYEKYLGKSNWLISTPIRDLKIGEEIYDEKGNYIAYRTQ